MIATTRNTDRRGDTMPGEWMTVAEAAGVLDVDPSRVRALIKAGRLQAARHGERVWMIERASVEELQAKRPPRAGGRPRKDRRDGAPSVEVALDQAAVERAGAAAMRGLPLVDAATGAVVSPQVVAFAAGLAAARARRGVYRASEGADVSVDGAVYRIRLYEGAPDGR